MFLRLLLVFLMPICLLAQSTFSTKTNTKHAVDLINSLNPDQKKIMLFPFDELNRYDWHFVPPTQSARTGVALKDLDSMQKILLHKMLHGFLSDKGYDKTNKIMDLEYILVVLEPKNKARIPENYFVSIYGMPGKDDVWAWKFTGHHLALNFTVIKDKIAVAPFFFGANPGTVKDGPQKGFRALKDEEDLGFELIDMLDDTQRAKAIFTTKAFSDIITYNSPQVKPLEDLVLLASEMTAAQKVVLEKIIATYLASMPEKIAKFRQKKIMKEDFNEIRFGWAGATKIGEGHYYRVQGKTFLIEFDNTQNNANHIHAVWRDFDGGDYGLDLIKAHYQQADHKH